MKRSTAVKDRELASAPVIDSFCKSLAASCTVPASRLQIRPQSRLQLELISETKSATQSEYTAALHQPSGHKAPTISAEFVRSISVGNAMRTTPHYALSKSDEASSPKQNHMLSALPRADFNRLLPHLEWVEMPLGDILYESGGRLQYVFFPTTSIVSLLYVLADGAPTEIAAVGNEGILGISTFMGGETTPSRAVVQSAGFGYRLKVQLLKQEFDRAGPLFRLLLRYTQALMTQMTQMAVCNRHHSLEQQLCRRLLFSLDRLPTDSIVMTQELLANTLGVRREGVTAAAGNLQRAGLIRYSRGRIEILDRPGLEAAVCECYAVVKLEFNRLLSDNHKSDPFHAVREPEQYVVAQSHPESLQFSVKTANFRSSQTMPAHAFAGGE
jgi:CRP-like cAMP-binding protein